MEGYNGRLSELIYKYPMQVGQNKSICIPLHENEKFKDWIYSIDEDYPDNIREIRIEFFARMIATKHYCYDQYILWECCMLNPVGYTYLKRMCFENPYLWTTYDELIKMSHNKCNVDDVVNEILHLWYEDFDKDYKFSYYIKPHKPEIHTD